MVIVKELKMVETLLEADTFIAHGHIMVGNEIIKDPDFLVPRNLTDHITWNDKSKIKRKIKEFNNEQDDYDLVF